jgi:putative photosynthetic complex assembly protein
MSHEIFPNGGVPRGPLLAIGALLLATLLTVSAVRLSGMPIRQPDAEPAVSRTLRFEDRPDGSVAVIEARENRELVRLTGEQGFLRGALRALSRERAMRGLGPEHPFELIGRADGRLTLVDPATGERIDLESFGPTNAGVFARLLELEAPRPAGRPN